MKRLLQMWKVLGVVVILCTGMFFLSGCANTEEAVSEDQGYRTITDMRGRVVQIPEDISRVVTGGYGFAPNTMVAFGVEDKIVGTGGAISHLTETTATFLNPEINSLPDLGGGHRLNVEALAALDPELVILEVDGGDTGAVLPQYDRLMDTLELFDDSFASFVINNPACYTPPTIRSIYREISLLGEIFNKQNRADEIISIIQEQVRLVEERTADIEEEDKPRVLFMALMGGLDRPGNPLATALPDYDCGTLFPYITKIKNAHTENTRESLSAEHLLAMDPDVIILVRSPAGYEVSQLYDEDYYTGIREMKAIKEGEVYSTGQFQLHRNMAGLEIGIEMLLQAKAVYPDRFKDIKVGELLTEHYRAIYNLNDQEIGELKDLMGLSWMDEEGF